MKNATPKINEVEQILGKVKKLIKDCKDYFSSKDINKENIIDDFVYLEKIIITFYKDNSLSNQELEKVKLLFKLENHSIHTMNVIWNNLGLIKKTISKYNKTENKLKELLEVKLKLPIKWQDITFYYDGDNIEISQKDSMLGLYSFDELYFPKIKGKGGKSSVKDFFISFFFMEDKENNQIKDKLILNKKISTKDNNKQALKSKLKKILCNLFHTNEDPFEDVLKNKDSVKTYKPKYRMKLSGDLRINNYSSGGDYDDNIDYTD